MLTNVADGVLVHESDFIHSNAVVVQGREGVLLIDPGISGDEMAVLAHDLRDLGHRVVAGFATHPDWDHALWHPDFGDAPRFGTARCAAALAELMSTPDWKDRMADVMPTDAGEIPLDLFGLITGLPGGSERLPWDGPDIRIMEHQAHASGHAALLIEERGVLVAGDMLSDILMPFLDLDAADPIEDYLAALRLFEGVAGRVKTVIPGHGSVGDAAELLARIDLDREYVENLRAGGVLDDPRVGPTAPLEWLPDVHDWQVKRLADRTAKPNS